MDVCAKVVEKIIRTYPIQFNPFRNISRMYDVEEGYEIIRQAKLVKTKYALHQELVIPHCDFTKNGCSALMQAVTKLEKEDAPVSVAIYTCGGYIFLIGCRRNHVFLVDTHSIGAEGNGNGILKVYPSNDPATPFQLCTWIWKTLQNSGVQAKALQSLVFLRHLSRYIFMFVPL